MHLPTSIATHKTSSLKPATACPIHNKSSHILYNRIAKEIKISLGLIILFFNLLQLPNQSLKAMVCGSCFNNCPFKTRWHDNLDITHERLTKAYRQLENLQTHLLTIPILRRDRSHTGLKIKNLKRVIKKREEIVDQINWCLDLDDCEICAACPY
jgi:ferredoxin